MCDDNQCGCQGPKPPKKKPEECPPKQVEECHGDAAKHPCEQKAEDDQ